MANYTLNYSDSGKIPLSIKDLEKDDRTDLVFYGKGYSGYGEDLWNNFLHLMENFCNGGNPSNPTEGQLWYNNVNHVLKVYKLILPKLIPTKNANDAIVKLKAANVITIIDFDTEKLKTDIVNYSGAFDDSRITLNADLVALQKYYNDLPNEFPALTESSFKTAISDLILLLTSSLESEMEPSIPKQYEWVELVDIKKLEKLYGSDGINGILKKLIGLLSDPNNAMVKELIAELNKLYLSINGGELLGPLKLFPYSTEPSNDPKITTHLAATVKYVDDAIANFDLSKLIGFDMAGFSGDMGGSETSGTYLEKVLDISGVLSTEKAYSKTQIILPEHSTVEDDNLAASRAYVKSKVGGDYLESSTIPKVTGEKDQYVKNNLILPSTQSSNVNSAVNKKYADGLIDPKNTEFSTAVNAVVKIPSSTSTSTTIDYSLLVAELFKPENKAKLLALFPSITDEIIYNYHINKGYSHGKYNSALNAWQYTVTPQNP